MSLFSLTLDHCSIFSGSAYLYEREVHAGSGFA